MVSYSGWYSSSTPRPAERRTAIVTAALPNLPIADVLPALRDALLAANNVVLIAPPGAGKTTVVPLALLDAPWLAGRRIVMLEPRRLATRNAAHRMAESLGESVGDTVGYRIRRDTRVSRRTRIEVVTEGVLTRMLATDPTLDGIGLVVFDEFHERSLHADVGLALTRHTQQLVRDDLRLLVMSATLAGDAVAAMLDARCIRSEGAHFPVELRYVPPRQDLRTEGAVAACVHRALRETTGDLLVFLPGQGEIARTAPLLELPSGIELHLLYGNLSFDEQDRALRPAHLGRRKVILATSIAESSLTIDGVRVVIDSGWSRVPRFSPSSGMTRLHTVRVSQASADQRAGRAGRQGPGVCYRLWSLEEQAHLLAFGAPEIAEADLAPFALELAAAGVRDPAELSWLDPPAPSRLALARGLLAWLDAVDADGRITTHGRTLAALGTHPRLAHMLASARDLTERVLACDLAALLEERDVFGTGPMRDADLRLRLDAMRRARTGEHVSEVAGMPVHRESLRRVLDSARAWRRELGIAANEAWAEDHAAGRLVALAYPDRVGQRRGSAGARYLLRNGTGAVLRDAGGLQGAPYLAIADTDGRAPEAMVYLAVPVDLDDLRMCFGAHLERRTSIEWHHETDAMRGSVQEVLGALVLSERPMRDVDESTVRQGMLDRIRHEGLSWLPFDDRARAVRERLGFLHAHLPDWPDVSDSALLHSLDDWLAPHLAGLRRRSQLAALDWSGLLLDRCSWGQRASLERLAPTHYQAPTGSRLPIDYSDAQAPVLRVRLQEMFGVSGTPAVLDGRVPLTLHLLSPAHRPVQVTRDLAGFWRSSYEDVRKEMKGRYPRHPWPDDPLSATPTRRAKPRGT